jgi:hypothetical protein
MNANVLLKSIYEKGGRKPWSAVSFKALIEEFGGEFGRLLQELGRHRYVVTAPEQIWLNRAGHDRAVQLFER